MDYKAEKLLLRPSEVADAIGCSRSKGCERIARKRLPSIRLDGDRLVRVPYAAIKEIVDRAIAGSEPDRR